MSEISLHRVSTAEAVADTLVSLIVSGTLRAGEPLRESTLAARLGISRNSLREAIRLLERSRLVTYEVHRGAVVSTPTAQNLDDLYRTRLHLELAAVQQVPTIEQLAILQEAFETLKHTSRRKNAQPIVAADLAWHQAIVGLLGSERISSFYQQICKELVFYFTVLSYTDAEYVNPNESIVSRHESIHQAILAGDRDTATTLLRQHIEDNFERLREILTNTAAHALASKRATPLPERAEKKAPSVG